MNLHQYIVEATLSQPDRNKFEVIWKSLWKECQPFLKEIKKMGGQKHHFIWRGTDNTIGDFKRVKPRKNRYPKDTPQELHEKIDSAFYQKFKWYPRSEGVFTSGSKGQAKAYGTRYLFFPVGKYKFIWSNDIDDLYSRFENEGHAHEFDEGDANYDWEWKYGEGKEGTWYYDDNDTDEHDYGAAEDEVKENILDDPDDFDDSLMGWQPDIQFEEYIDEIRRDYEDRQEDIISGSLSTYTDKDLKKAISYGHEITFKCKSYYLVDEKYIHILEDYIKNKGQMKLPFKWEDYKFLPQYLQLMSHMRLDEGKMFDLIQSLGVKLGLKVKKSDSIFKYLKDFGKEVDDIIRLSSLYLITDITDSKSRKDIAKDIKNILKRTDKKEMAAFMLMLDKDTIGITSHFRHLMHSLFGIEVSVYHKWLDDIEYMKKELRQIRIVLKRMGGTEKELSALKQFENIILNMEKI